MIFKNNRIVFDNPEGLFGLDIKPSRAVRAPSSGAVYGNEIYGYRGFDMTCTNCNTGTDVIFRFSSGASTSVYDNEFK